MSPGPVGADLLWQLDGRLLELLEALCRSEPGTGFERVEQGAYVVVLPGTRRPSTVVWLIAGPQAVVVEVFVLHVTAQCADPAPLHRLLLAHNLRLRDVHFGLDDVGDVFLTGSVPLAALEADVLDRVLGEVLQLLEAVQPALERAAYGALLQPRADGSVPDEALLAKVRLDGAGRRPAGTPEGAPRRDVRR